MAVLTGDVIDHNRDGGVADVTGNEAAETLLTRRVPELESNLRGAGGRERDRERERDEKRKGRGGGGERQNERAAGWMGLPRVEV